MAERRGAYERYLKTGSKKCLDCPTTISGGKRCPICADIHTTNLHRLRSRKRARKISAARAESAGKGDEGNANG